MRAVTVDRDRLALERLQHEVGHDPGDAEDLAAKVRWAVDHLEEMRQMGTNARRVYEAKYTPEENYQQLTALYEAAIAEASRRRPASP